MFCCCTVFLLVLKSFCVCNICIGFCLSSTPALSPPLPLPGTVNDVGTPYRPALVESVRLLYQGMLRTLLVLLHDFPEFLSDYHLSFCDVIPPSCIQLRNLVLAAFPRSMRLPDPFTPNLKVCRVV